MPTMERRWLEHRETRENVRGPRRPSSPTTNTYSDVCLPTQGGRNNGVVSMQIYVQRANQTTVLSN
jgi:hypothetical protein